MVTSYKVELTKPALQDLKEIFNWVAANDSRAKASNLLDKLQETSKSLADLPLRGHALPELQAIGSQNYLEIHQGPYRIIYHIHAQAQGQIVYIDAILDGRRDMQELLSARLFI